MERTPKGIFIPIELWEDKILSWDEKIMVAILSDLIENGGEICRADRKRWLRITADDLSRQVKFWNSKKIRRITKSLEEKGVLLIGEYNESPYDHTKWYALSKLN